MSTDAWFREFERGEGARLSRLEEARDTLKGHELVERLKRLVEWWTQNEDIPMSQQSECRDIGRQLYALGGEALMREAYYEAKGVNNCASVCAAYWDGIGEWRW